MEYKKENHLCEDRLLYLHSIKSELIPKQRKWKRKYKWERIKERSKTKSDYKTNTLFSIINAKKSEILTGLQEFDFIPMDDNAQRNIAFVKKIWAHEWLATKTDKHLSNAIHSSCISWDWFVYEWIRRIDRMIKVPSMNSDWFITYKEELVTDYNWIYCEYIPWENIYFDWLDIDKSNEAVWIKYWDRKEFIQSFELNPNYKNVNNDLPVGKHYYLTTDGSQVTLEWDLNSQNVISELRYYNKSRDELIILANWVEIYNWIIPYKHKELPFAKFEDYKLDDRFYSMWEYELLEEDEEYKDALRSLNIDVIKAQFWFTVIDPDADFDEATIEIWTNKFARLDPNAIRHFAPNINANTIIQAEQAANEDLIIKSWIDFRWQILWKSETATKTQAREQSARKRINLNLKFNGYSFFERLARLRMSNISFLYGLWKKTIPLKWGNINSEWIYSPLNGWYWTFVVKPEYVKWAFNIVPITESILWISSEREKSNFLWFVQIAGNLMENWAPVFPWSKIWEELAKQFWLSYEDLTWKSPNSKTPEDIINELQSEMKWEQQTPMANENYIPPAQRSWAMTNVPILWWWISNE